MLWTADQDSFLTDLSDVNPDAPHAKIAALFNLSRPTDWPPVTEDSVRNRLRRLVRAPEKGDTDDTTSKLRDALYRTTRQLGEAKAKKEELVEAVFRAASDAAAALELSEIPVPPADRRPKPETAVAMLSDWQLAKLTTTYNSLVCEERVRLYADKVIELANIQRADHPVTDLHVWLLGDLIEGELIFPGQAHMIDASLYRQITVDGPRILGDFLRRMLANFETVHVTAVIGNHGQLGGSTRRDHNPETNGDRMLYRIVQQILAGEERLTWNIPDGDGERRWYAVDTIGNYSALLLHGDQIRGGFGGFPFYGLAKKVWGWASGSIPEPFKDVALGHWHQPTRVTLNSITARVNGSTESDNSYAQEQLAASGSPSQWLLFVEPSRGRVSAEYVVYLDDVAA